VFFGFIFVRSSLCWSRVHARRPDRMQTSGQTLSAALDPEGPRQVAFRIGCALVVFVIVTSCSRAPKSLDVATTTSVQNSGLLETLLPHFQEATIRVHAAGSGRALAMHADGIVDLVISDAPETEARFLADPRRGPTGRLPTTGSSSSGRRVIPHAYAKPSTWLTRSELVTLFEDDSRLLNTYVVVYPTVLARQVGRERRRASIRSPKLEIVATSSAGSIGFARCAWYPARKARVRSSVRAYAVSATAGMTPPA
jgi:hypothetical protein